MEAIMNIKYFFGLCAIGCSLAFGAHAFEYTVVKEPTPVVAILDTSEYVNLSKKVNGSVHNTTEYIPFFNKYRIPTEHVNGLFKYGSALISAIIGIVRSIMHICTEMVTMK
ncbi:hypothetical protein V4P56_02060 [Bartonella sp. B35(2025)]